jgi:hypothetical protein
MVNWNHSLASPTNGERQDWIELSWLTFVLTGTLVLLIASLTVGLEAIRAAVANPTNSLRSE